jgi:sialic acid synthase SpsE
VGLSDHTPGVEVSKIAVSIGADLIEKHITVDQSLPGPDHHFSLLPQELKELCDFVKFSGAVLGSPFKTCVESENKMKYIGRRVTRSRGGYHGRSIDNRGNDRGK